MTNSAGRARVANDPYAIARLEDLLVRYPSVSADESDEIAMLLRGTGPFDMGLLSANALAWTKAEHYRRDHPARFRMHWRERLFWLVSAAGVIIVLIVLWDMGVT